MSIRYHLIIRLFIASLLLVGAAALVGYKDLQYESRELFDGQLARSARLILSMLQADVEQNNFSSIQQFLNQNQLASPLTEAGSGIEELESGHVYETKLGFQVWDHLGNLILKSSNVPIDPISELANGYSDRHFMQHDWRVFSLTSQDTRYRCIAAERIDVRNDLIGKISSDLLTLFLLLIPVLLLTMWIAIRQGLSSLQNLAAQIQHLGVDKLDSLSQQNAPAEIITITGALNQLLLKLKNALAREKRITSDAAHELRTPLAAVKLHAELARTAHNERERKESIAQVLLGIDRTTHLVDQILALARLEPESFSQQLSPVNLSRLVIDEVAMLAPLAYAKNIEISVNEGAELSILAEDTSLRLMVRNLINNAIIYTQPGGEIEVSVSIQGGAPCLIVMDNGPGIADTEKERVMERFYRVENHAAPGCGIGLSIVMRVVELLNARLKMEDSDRHTKTGLKVIVCFKNIQLDQRDALLS
ncbi:MAG: sensor histidine kinase N-terminal domain-containing protein [Gammaproteobacteria bacterium]|nr:sensor histidine kinase N-terminal domain-containing protein [Gammaproteobacteria bacterium]